jgi:hypothetical protein
MAVTVLSRPLHGEVSLRPRPKSRRAGRQSTERVGEFLAGLGRFVWTVLYIALILAILAVLFVPTVISGARR